MRVIRVGLYALILVSLLFVPLHRVEIANLEPIKAVWMYMENSNIVLTTDTENKGSGVTVEMALSDMREKSPGILYLDTAQFLFVSDSAQKNIPAIGSFVKGNIRLCKWGGQGNIKTAVKYADSHNIGLKLSKWNDLSKLPELPPLK